jgi:hypothetical protein
MPTRNEILRSLRYFTKVQHKDLGEILDYTDQQATEGQPAADIAIDDVGTAIGHWKLDEASQAVPIVDRISGRDGTLDAAVAFQQEGPGTGAFAIQLDGTAQEITVPTDASLNEVYGASKSFTIEIWYKSTSVDPGVDQRLFFKRDGTPEDGAGWMLSVTAANVVSADMEDTATSVYNRTGTTNVTDGLWHHIVMVRDHVNAELRLYVDGSLDVAALSVSAAVSFESANALIIGNNDANGLVGTDGFLSGAVLYASALSGTEVETLRTVMVRGSRGDNLGDHIAEQNLDMAGFNVTEFQQLLGQNATTATGDAPNVFIRGGAGGGTGATSGGDVQVIGGASTGTDPGGNIAIQAGSNTDANGAAGDITIAGGSPGPTSTGAEGSTIGLIAGAGGLTTGNGGPINITGIAGGIGGTTSGQGGCIWLEAGVNGVGGSGGSGNVMINTQTGIGPTGGSVTVDQNPGLVSIYGVNNNANSVAAGAVEIWGGYSFGTGSGSIGGNVSIWGGGSGGGGEAGGHVQLFGGKGDDIPGQVEIIGGGATNTVTGGAVLIDGGPGGDTGGTGGTVSITGGTPAATDGSGGAVNLVGGPAKGVGAAGVGGQAGITGGSSRGTFPGGSVRIIGGAALGTGAGGAIDMDAQAAGTGGNNAGGAITIDAGEGDGSGLGGAISIKAGEGGVTATGGNATFQAGTGGATSGAGGVTTIQGGGAGVGGAVGGNVVIRGGLGIGANAGGDTTIFGGNPGTTGAGGNVTITGGGGGATSGNGGALTMTAGSATTSGQGGAATISGGDGDGSGFGGNVNVLGGSGVGSSGGGGGVVITAGAPAGGNVTGAVVDIDCGNGSGSGNGGQFQLNTGNGGATGDGGQLTITAGGGGATSGDGGLITILGGDSQTSGNGGDIRMEGGPFSSGEKGVIDIRGVLGFDVQVDGEKTAAFDFDPNIGLVHTVTHGAAATAEYGISAFKNTNEIGVELTLYLTNFGQGTPTWGTEIEWAGGSPPTFTAAGLDVVKFMSIDGGTSWQGWLIGANFS